MEWLKISNLITFKCQWMQPFITEGISESFFSSALVSFPTQMHPIIHSGTYHTYIKRMHFSTIPPNDDDDDDDAPSKGTSLCMASMHHCICKVQFTRARPSHCNYLHETRDESSHRTIGDSKGRKIWPWKADRRSEQDPGRKLAVRSVSRFIATDLVSALCWIDFA